MEESELTPEQTGAEETQSEEQTPESTSSEVETPEDTTTEESPQEEEPEVKKPGRARERIQELVRERNFYKNLANKPQASQNTFDGIDETGIDPVKFGESAINQARTAASETAKMEIEALRAEQDFPLIKTSRVLQNIAKAYVNEGFGPYDAAVAAYDDYQGEMKGKEESAKKRVQADKNLRSASFTPSGLQQNKAEHAFSEDEIASMDIQTYEANKEKIFKQYGIK